MRPNILKITAIGVFFLCCSCGVWAGIAIVAALHHVNWQVTELLRQYMIATGMIRPTHTLVDFYTQIKGIEYLICVGFFVVFPLFYRYVSKERPRVRTGK
jgi:hypothetical protein